MISITEAKKRLPKEFMDNLYEMFSPGTVDNILYGILGKRLTTLRANTLQYDIQELMRYLKETAIKFERVPWYEEALVIKNAEEKDLQKLSILQEGKIYLQSLSSMVPPIILNPKPGERVLDLTAAPGSKTTQMAAMMQNKGYILANELDKIRIERLQYNVEKQGAKIVELSNRRGEKIGEQYPESFDKVLLDAPCSGEGRFLVQQVASYRNWSYKTVQQLAKLQKKLLQSAYHALKPNGTLVYSTCTLNTEENERVLNWALENLNLKMLNIEVEIADGISGFTDGVDSSIKKAIRILPSKNKEGFFVAKMKKGNK